MNIIITGGSNGIGKQIALQLANDEHNTILITGRDVVTLSKVAESAKHRNINFLDCDFRDLHLSNELFKKEVNSIFNSVDILINNAGTLVSKEFEEITDSEAREMMEVNFFAPVEIIRTLLPLMKKGSHIVNISSMGGFQGSAKFTGLSYYSASKAALACISECLAAEFQKLEISVNCLALGSVQTEMVKKAFPGYEAPVSADDMGRYIADFALNGSKVFNGKIIPVAFTTI